MSRLLRSWKTATLSEICTRIVDGSHNPPKAVGAGFPMLSARNVQSRRIHFNEFRFISGDDFASEHQRTQVQSGDVLLTIVGAIGRSAVVPDGIRQFVLQRSVAVLKPLLIESRFLSYVLQSPDIQRYLEENAKGTAQKGIYLRTLAGIEIPVAPLNEQKRIADKLDALLIRVDACRERLGRVPLILKQFRQSVLAAGTSGKLTEDWRAEKGVDTKNWTTKLGAEVFQFVTSGSRGWAAYYANSGAAFLRVGNLDHNTVELDLSEIQRVQPPAGSEGERTRVRVGDILISITADVGMVALIRDDLGEAYINQHLCLARQSGQYLGAFLAYYLASPIGGLAQLSEAQRGMTKAGLTLGDIRNLTFKIPSVEEQHEIVRRMESLLKYADRLEACYKAAKARVEQLTPALLSKAFRGELVPQDPKDEPAAVLLERIRASSTRAQGTQETERVKRRTKSVKKPKAEIIMLKRKDVEPSHLSDILKAGGPRSAESLWSASQLDIDDFYDQLKEEEVKGLLRESVGEQRLLEAA